MNTADLEYLLQRTYFQGRANSGNLINRENALASSTASLLSKISPESLESQRKLIELGRCLMDTIDPEERAEELEQTAEAVMRLEEEFILMLAKHHKLPACTNSRFSAQTESSECPEIEAQLMELLSPDTDATVASADAYFSQMHDEYLKSIGKDHEMDCDEEIVDLAQKVNESSMTAHSPAASTSNFMTAKQALVKNANNRVSPPASSQAAASGSGYNPAAQMRRLGLGNKRPRPNAAPEPTPSQYRGDEGRDINTEFSYYNMTKNPMPQAATSTGSTPKQQVSKPTPNQQAQPEEPVDERLANIEPRLIEMIRNEIMSRVDDISWNDIAGLEHAKKSIFEIVIWPMLKPEIFKGLLSPPKGVLLFGPPGTGKTMIGKCIAGQAKATFFSISASSLTSKWVGEGEKMVRALFAVARCHQPSVIFIDEIDSLLTQRTDGEVEASRRIKTEFLVQFDGAGTNSEDRILVIGATNRPQELDEAARRRLVKRLYVPLPDAPARISIIRKLMSMTRNALTEEDITWICDQTDGYSGADVDNLCREAALGPVRSVTDLSAINQEDDLRAVVRADFEDALTQVRASVSNKDLELYTEWNASYGSLTVKKP